MDEDGFEWLAEEEVKHVGPVMYVGGNGKELN